MDQRPGSGSRRRHEQPSPLVITEALWTQWAPRYRAQFFNSLSGPRQVGLLTSLSPEGIANAAVFSQTLHVSANPPQLGFLFRPLTDEHQGLRYCRSQKAFGFHLLGGQQFEARQLHQCSAKYPEGQSELDSVGLHWQSFEHIPAPRITSALVAYGLRLDEEHLLANGSVLVVGSVIEVHLAPSMTVEESGFVPMPEDHFTAQGLDTYLHSKTVVQLPYAEVSAPLLKP